MSEIRINIDQIESTLKQVLDGYNDTVVEASKKNAKECMVKLVKETKATAPRRRPKYYKYISSKMTRNDKFGAEYTWYVKEPEYRLSHLLEYGHAKKNGGRTTAFGFIKKASEPIINAYVKFVEEAIKNG